jgi:hypothetical protein
LCSLGAKRRAISTCLKVPEASIAAEHAIAVISLSTSKMTRPS